jgi:hypothetical protein
VESLASARGRRPWRGAALLGADLETDVKLLHAFNRRHQDAGILIDTVEVKASSEREVGEIIEAVPSRWQTYIELPAARDPMAPLRAVRQGVPVPRPGAASDAQETRSGHFTRTRQWMIPANYPWWWGASAVTGYSDTRIELVA